MSTNKQRPRNDEPNRGQTGNQQRAERPGENDNEEFPGYPHYPPKEDIMSPSSEMERVQLDVENLSPSGRNAKQAETNHLSNQPITDATSSVDDEELDITTGTGSESDVTRDDLVALGGTRYSDNDLQSSTHSNLVSGDDLDIPGSELDNPNEEIGEEDEENNYYSLGGDRHENLEEDPTA
jgi:hypothetical protein